MIYDVLIIGGGAAGLAAAITAGRTGVTVAVCERAPEPGKKILITGGGRCNLTNAALADRRADFARLYGSAGRFVRPTLLALPVAALRDFWQSVGITTIAPDGLRYYPSDEKAASVRDALRRAAVAAGAEILPDCEITALEKPAGLWTARAADGREFSSAKIIFAPGGMAPVAFAAPAAWRIPAQLGHTMITPTPALAPLKFADFPSIGGEAAFSGLAGVSVKAIAVWIEQSPKKRVRGDLLFTHNGLSGPAIMDISADAHSAADADRQTVLRVNFLPECENFADSLRGWRQTAGRKTLHSLLRGQLPEALLTRIFTLSGIPAGRTAAELTARESKALDENLTARRIAVDGTPDLGTAMVTRGGVALNEVNPKTLESRIAPGLFFAGEILNVDGRCGGFNLHWAFASGITAARNAAPNPQAPH